MFCVTTQKPNQILAPERILATWLASPWVGPFPCEYRLPSQSHHLCHVERTRVLMLTLSGICLEKAQYRFGGYSQIAKMPEIVEPQR